MPSPTHHNQTCWKQSALLLLVCCWIGGVAQNSAFGIGTETNMRHDDLNVTIDTRWAGCAHGGYYPIRIQASNLGKERTISFRFEPYNDGLPQVEKTISLKPNASLKFALSVPMVGTESNGVLNIAINRATVKEFRTAINLADVDGSSFDRPSMLVISPSTVAVERYEEAVTGLSSKAAPAGSAYGHGYGGSSRSMDHEVITPQLLPERWIDYSGLDFVAISLNEFGKLSQDARQALLDWAKTGGNLIVHEVGQQPELSSRLNELCSLDRTPTNWIDPKTETRVQVPLVAGDSYSGYTTSHSGSVEPYEWTGSPLPFQTRELLDGTLIAFEGNPFPGTRHEWSWLLNTLGSKRFRWTERHGLSARLGNDEFLQFMIPGISGVPVIAFLILITIFSIVIGPLNYVYLNRYKRLYLLVLTIPLIAVITSVSLFGYSIMAHGFSTKSRIRSLMTVDQRTSESIITTRSSLYSGLAPSGGLKFAADTAIYPVWAAQEQSGVSSGKVDWSKQQALTAGWLKSRTRTQFYLVTKRDERGRLTISAPANQSLKLSNGFEFDLAHLVVRGSDQQLYYGKNIRAGSQATLQLASSDHLGIISSEIRIHQPGLPENFDSSSAYGSYSSYDDQYDFHTQFAKNITERRISRFENSLKDELGEREYFGLFSENPDVPLGITDTKERDSLYLLHGYY